MNRPQLLLPPALFALAAVSPGAQHDEGPVLAVEVEQVAPADLEPYDHFGSSIDVDGDQAIVGAYGNN